MNIPLVDEHAAKRRYDLVLLDLNMPGLSRLDALAARREDAHDAKSIVLNDGPELNYVRDAESMNSGDGVTIVGARLEEKKLAYHGGSVRAFSRGPNGYRPAGEEGVRAGLSA